jgi:hypothetical protein
MTDIVMEIPVALGEEASLFTTYFQQFVDQAFISAVTGGEATLLMLRSDPRADHELKVVTFQEPAAAQAFTLGWTRIRESAAQLA